MKALSPRSAWSKAQTIEFLDNFGGPLRLAATTESGFPLICSLWYQYRDGRLLCATQKQAVITRHLERDGKCAFEVSTNDPPYSGLRGRGTATLTSVGAAKLLEEVSSRYLGKEDSPFRRWLRQRSADEVCIEIEPTWMTTWDYRNRMSE